MSNERKGIIVMIYSKKKILKLCSLIAPLLFSNPLFANDDKIVDQIIEGHEFYEASVHGSKINILESDAYKKAFTDHLKARLTEVIMEKADPLLQEEKALMDKIAKGDSSVSTRDSLSNVRARIDIYRDREEVRKIYREVKEIEVNKESNYCYDSSQATLRIVSGGEMTIRCITNESARNIVKVALLNPKDRGAIEVKTSSATKPEPVEIDTQTPEIERKFYFCYERTKNILAKESNCRPKRLKLSEDELEKVGRSNCYPIDQSYRYKPEDGFTPTAKLYGKCRDEICTNEDEQIDFAKFELISFSQEDPKQCINDNSKSRVCAQTYKCKNQTYQITCEFNDEESIGDNSCHVKSISNSTIENKCSVIELGTEV
ncbi:hypothetical protein [Halobacteriovorax sp. RT-2-1]|uniref:hypothetical protein n=2 Tax=unclassified Halobacteriovorax TaxID=2639665 RepID=UPI0039999CE0